LKDLEKNYEADELLCPFCCEGDLLMMEDCETFFLLCLSCKACGPVEQSAEDAMDSWAMRPTKEDIEELSKRQVYFS
jgi:hypothetical protein